MHARVKAFEALDRFTPIMPRLLMQVGGTAEIWKLADAYDIHIAQLTTGLCNWGIPAWTGKQTLEALVPYKRKMRTGHGDA